MPKFIRLFFVLFLWGPVCHAGCPTWLLEVLGRPLNLAVYETHVASMAYAPAPLSSLTTPEKLLAFADSYGVPFFREQLASIERLGGSVAFRNYWIPIGLNGHARAPSVRSTSRWSTFYGMPYLKRDGKAIITVANAPPYSMHQVVNWMVQLGSQLIEHQMALIARRSPLLPLRAPFPYSENALEELERAEHRLYSMIWELKQAHPHLQMQLAERDGVWHWKTLQTALGMPVRVIYPYYQSMGPYRANEEHLDAWKKKRLSTLLRAKYKTRLVSQWFVDRYRNLITTGALVALPFAANGIYQDVTSGDFQRQLELTIAEVRELPERFSAENLNRALRAYEAQPEGFRDVVEHYETQIAEIRKRIEAEGDPSGELQNEIDQLIASREALAK